MEQPRPLPFHLTLPFLFYFSQADETVTLNIKEIYTVQMVLNLIYYVGHLESKERLRIQPARLFNFS